MKSRIIVVMIIATMLIINSCDNQNIETVSGTGDVLTMEVDVPVFDGININGTCDVEIMIGDTQSVEFYAQSEIIEVLDYEVKNQILSIGFKPNYTIVTNKSITAQIVVPSVSSLAISGKGNFKLIGPKQEMLDIRITGSGDVKAFDMEVNNSTISISGVGNCEINAVKNLDVTISGIGTVLYLGNPKRSINITGEGAVTPFTP